MLPFLKEEVIGFRHQITFTGDKMYIYLPVSYLESSSGMAEVVGEYIETLGMFWFSYQGKYYECSLPLKFMFGFSDREKYTGKLKPELPEFTYDKFTLTKGDAFCYDINHRENIQDIMFFMSKLVEGGKLPATLAYGDVLTVFMSALDATKSLGLGVSAVTYELLLSELYRNKKNTTEPYRLYLNEHPDKQYDYKTIRVQKIPEMSSTFTGLMGEDNTQQIVAAVANNRAHKDDPNYKEKISPLEKVIKF